MGLSAENILREDLVWEIEIGCGEDGLKYGCGWGPMAVCAQQMLGH